MYFIDTHAHLYLDEFQTDISDVMQHATEAGIRKIVLPNIDSSSITPLHELADNFPDTCIPLMGLHPTYVKEDYKIELE